MMIALGILTALFAALVLLLVLPVRIALRASGGSGEPFEAGGSVRFLGGLFGVGGEYRGGCFRPSILLGPFTVATFDAGRFRRFAGKPKPSIEPGGSERGEAESVPKRTSAAERIRSAIDVSRRHRSHVKLVMREIPLLVRIDRFDARVKLGFGDPSLTGWIVGMLAAINGMLPERFVIRPEWDFTRAVISGGGSLSLTFRSHLFWVHLARELVRMRSAGKEQCVPVRGGVSAQEA
jgi:hypothetical protein